MRLSKYDPVQRIDIWSPRWHDRVVLVDTKKMGQHNIITFSKSKTLPYKYYISGEVARRSPIDSNGKIRCYAIPLDELQLYEGRTDD